MRSAGPALVSRHIPAAEAGRAVTVSLKAGEDGAFVTEMDMGLGQVGFHRGTPPIATTVSDAQHWALAGRRRAVEEVEVRTEHGEAVEVVYGEGVWMSIIDPFEEDLPVEVRSTGDGCKVRLRTIKLPRFESPPTERGPWPSAASGQSAPCLAGHGSTPRIRGSEPLLSMQRSAFEVLEEIGTSLVPRVEMPATGFGSSNAKNPPFPAGSEVRLRGVEPPRPVRATRPSTLRVYQFRHSREGRR